MWAGSSIKTWLGTVHSKKKVEGSLSEIMLSVHAPPSTTEKVMHVYLSSDSADCILIDFRLLRLSSDNPSIIWTSQIPSLLHRNYQTTQSLQPLTRKQCGLPFQFLSFQV